MNTKYTEKTVWVAIFTILLIFNSCTKDLDMGKKLPSETEIVNGISVTWKEGVTEQNRQFVKDFINDMVLVEGGIFLMGDNDIKASDNKKPAHYVKLTDYYILAHEMTEEQINRILIKPQEKYLGYSYNEWEKALKILSSYSNIKFSIPTEAQWEYAAMGGIKSKGYKYPGADTYEEVWTNSETAPGCLLPNELGIYNMADLHGEWCQDIYDTYKDGVMPTNPCNTIQSSLFEYRVVRGGCYLSTGYLHAYSTLNYRLDTSKAKSMCQSKARANYSPESGIKTVVCRPVINIEIE